MASFESKCISVITHHIPRIEGLRRHPDLVEPRGHDPDGAPLPVAHQLVQAFGAQLLDQPDAIEHVFALLQEGLYVSLRLSGEVEGPAGPEVEGAEGLNIDAATLEGHLPRREEGIGGFPHGGADD